MSGSCLTKLLLCLQEVAARAERTVKDLRRKAEQTRRQHALELAAAEQRVWEARARKVMLLPLGFDTFCSGRRAVGVGITVT